MGLVSAAVIGFESIMLFLTEQVSRPPKLMETYTAEQDLRMDYE